MTLKELAAEYRESAQMLKDREEFIKKQIKTGKGAILDLQTRLKYLRTERYQALETANYLENYYALSEAKLNA